MTKYNVRATAALPRLPSDRETVLVPGQVADDWAVLTGRPQAFRRPKRSMPCSCRVSASATLWHSSYLSHTPMLSIWGERALWTEIVTRALPISSLPTRPGFPTAPGQPCRNLFLALGLRSPAARHIPSWSMACPSMPDGGLSEDVECIPRRGRQRDLGELVAVALLRYPRYWDPESARLSAGTGPAAHRGGAGTTRRLAAALGPSCRQGGDLGTSDDAGDEGKQTWRVAAAYPPAGCGIS